MSDYLREVSTEVDLRRWIALSVICLGTAMTVIDATIVNVALPTIQRSLGFSQASLAWVIDAYLISYGGLLLMAGRLGDLLGRKKIFLGGVTLFTVSSVFCGMASSQAMLIGGRFVQGAGAALTASVVLAMIVGEFRNLRTRAKAISVYVVVAIGGSSFGLLIGGILIQFLSWHWIFFINVPIGICTLVAGFILLDESRGLGIRAGLDVGGAVLSTASLMLVVYTIVTSAEYGWSSGHTILFGSAAVVSIVAFFLLESRLTNPIMPIPVLRSRGLGSTSVTRMFTGMGQFSTGFIGVLFFQHILGFDALQTGAAFLPQTLILAAMTLGPANRITRALRPKPTALIGMALTFSGLVLFAFAGPHTAYFPQILVSTALMGVGTALTFTPLLNIGVSGIPKAHAGLGTGVVNVSTQVAGALCVAILGVISSNRTRSLLAAGSPPQHALAGGYRLALLAAAGCLVIGGVLCVALVPSHIRRPDDDGNAEGVHALDLAPVVQSVET